MKKQMTCTPDCYRSEVVSLALKADVGHPHPMADKPFKAGKGIVHMVFVSHFLGDGSGGFDDVR